MLCFSVDSPESLENVESKWVGEIAENCPGVKLVLVALKCDLRGETGDEDGNEPKRPCIDYKQGLAVAEKIKALRYLGETSSHRILRVMLTERLYRMLSETQPRRQRSVHRSRESSVDSQSEERQAGRTELLQRNVKRTTATNHLLEPTHSSNFEDIPRYYYDEYC